MYTKRMTLPMRLTAAGRQSYARMCLAMSGACGMAAAMSSVICLAENTAINSALENVFDALESVADTVQTGITGVILPIGIAVCLYFVARMILASDAKDAAMFKKRAITVAILVAIAFAIPGLLAAMKTLGESINGTLASSGVD